MFFTQDVRFLLCRSHLINRWKVEMLVVSFIFLLLIFVVFVVVVKSVGPTARNCTLVFA